MAAKAAALINFLGFSKCTSPLPPWVTFPVALRVFWSAAAVPKAPVSCWEALASISLISFCRFSIFFCLGPWP